MTNNLEQALARAAELKYEETKGGNGVAVCDECGEETFEIYGLSGDGSVAYGKCLNCGYEKSEEEAEDEEFDHVLERHEDD